ncbi:AraC family transcriptional regulator [Clostridium sp. C105KSO13]|uniref:AraC family transcriptional regulator n=1 Tax=Clostridium sp. C105KSO13 TaxID=1776045 RepID=UPI00074060FC|nr:helix-turn-helix domain-containing protein [Clostridium sp. C105KSO13]CUX25019.1 DNA-binding transcriptional regulator AraC [Clostridium sp. C105KSO13]
MNQELLQQLRVITDEEQKILIGKDSVQKSLYTSEDRFIVDSNKLLKKGKLIEIRPHTRFIHFPRHRHNYVEMVYMCKGQTRHIINGSKELPLKTGDLLFMNQNAYHEIFPASEHDIAVNFIILPEFFQYVMKFMDNQNILFEFLISTLSSSSNDCDYLYFRTENILPIQNLLENMIWTIINKDTYQNTINQVTMGLLFLNLLEYADVLYQNTTETYEQKIIFSSLKYVRSNYKTGTLEELSSTLNLPTYTLSRLLKKYTGFNFKELLIRQKMEQAAYLLSKTSLSTESILHSIGYENSSFFHIKFREIYGKTPKEFRKEQAFTSF